MTNILDTQPDAEAYAFTYKFQVGHALRPARMSQLRVEWERHVEEARVFLDAAGLVDGVEAAAEPLDASVPLGAHDLTSDDIRVLPVVEWRTAEQGGAAWRRSPESLSGLTVTIPAGTELGVSPSPAARDAGDGLRIRFPRDTDVEVGVRGTGALERHRVRGMRPVLLNGIPLLEVTASDASRVDLALGEAKTAILSLLIVVSPYRRRGGSALLHVMESIGDTVVGGTSVQFRV